MSSPRLLLTLTAALLATAGCGNDSSLVVERTPTPGAPTDTPDEPTPAQVAIIRVEPTEIDFGAQGIGCVLNRDITLHNDGGAKLSVYSAAMSIASSTDFSVPEDSLIEVDPRSSKALTLTYEVKGSGEDTGTLLLQSNDQEAGTVTVAVRGESSPNVPFEQSFVQTSGGSVDLLFALDVSTYVNDYVGALVVNLDLLITAMNDGGLDWHMGWISTDPVDAADLHGTYGEDERRYLTAEDGDEAIEDFKSSIVQRLAALSSSQTPGLQLINVALSEENLAGENAGFVRDDALLAIMVVSAYDDDSQNAQRLPIPVTELATTLGEVKGEGGSMRFDSVVAERSGSCAKEQGARYLQMTSIIGGFSEDICFHTWANTLPKLAQALQNLSDAFVLDEAPEDPSTVTVDVAGQPVVRDSANGFTFDSARNAVVFHGEAIPPAGATVVVRFQRGGDCHE